MGKRLIRKGRRGDNVHVLGHVFGGYHKHARSELGCG